MRTAKAVKIQVHRHERWCRRRQKPPSGRFHCGLSGQFRAARCFVRSCALVCQSAGSESLCPERPPSSVGGVVLAELRAAVHSHSPPLSRSQESWR